MTGSFSPHEAAAMAHEGRLEEWVHAYLLGIGKNKPLSDGLKKQRRHWLGPILVPLSKLTRCCGPEEGMAYRESEDAWQRRTQEMVSQMRAGWEPAPLIAHYEDGALVISDGNHRHEALVSLGETRYWTIIWCDAPEALEKAQSLLG